MSLIDQWMEAIFKFQALQLYSYLNSGGHDASRKFQLDVTGYTSTDRKAIDLASFSFIKNADEVMFFDERNHSLQEPMTGYKVIDKDKNDETIKMSKEYDQEGIWDNKDFLKGDDDVLDNLI